MNTMILSARNRPLRNARSFSSAFDPAEKCSCIRTYFGCTRLGAVIEYSFQVWPSHKLILLVIGKNNTKVCGMKKKECHGCGAVESKTIRSSVARVKLTVCSQCGFVLSNRKTFAEPNLTKNARLGAHGKAGRTFEMARLGALLTQSYDLKAAIHKPGVDCDTDRISNIPMICDVHRLESSKKHNPYSFDLILMNETLQSLDSRASLIEILTLLTDNGLAICSSDLNDDQNLSKSRFFNSKYTRCMWSGKSLISVGRDAGMFVDFRVPQIAVRNSFKRKRYVIFYKSEKIERAIRLYFSKSAHAPSE